MRTIKTIRTLLVAGTVATLLSACIPSVNPFYTTKDIRFEEQLLGEWRKKDDNKESWKFERANDQGYKLTVTEQGNKKGTFDARLFKVKDELFLDIIPNECKFADDQAEMVQVSLFPGHLLVRVSRSGSELKLTFFDFEWLEKHLKEHPGALAHRLEGDRMLLTAETRDLQRFVLQHLGEGELFQKPGEFVRE